MGFVTSDGDDAEFEGFMLHSAHPHFARSLVPAMMVVMNDRIRLIQMSMS